MTYKEAEEHREATSILLKEHVAKHGKNEDDDEYMRLLGELQQSYLDVVDAIMEKF